MNHFIKYIFLVCCLFMLSLNIEAQKKHRKLTKATVAKTLKAKKNKAKQRKKKTRLNPIDQIIFKDPTPITNEPVFVNKVDTVPEKVVSILSAFKPQLKNVAKISFTTATAQTDTTSLNLNFDLPSQNLSFQYQPVALVPRTYKSYPTQVSGNLASLKVGYGNNAHHLIDLNSTLTDQHANLHSFTIFNESTQGPLHLQKTSDLVLKYLSDYTINQNNHLQTQLFYQNSQRSRYGLVDDATNLPNSNFDQGFAHVGGSFKWVNTNEKNLFSLLSPTLKIEQFNGTETANNTWFEIYNPLSIRFDNKNRFNFNFSYNYNQYQLPNKSKINNAIFRMDPSYETFKWNTSFQLGISPTIANGEYTFTPALSLTRKLKDTSITLLAGWNTILVNNQYTLLAIANPWIMAPTDMKITTQEKKNIDFVFKRSKHLEYGFGISLNDYRNLPLFNRVVVDQSLSSFNSIQTGLKYQPIFEYRAITIELVGHLRYQMSDQLLFQNDFKYIQFNSIKVNDKPWGILPLELNSNITWSPNHRWTFDGGFNYWSGAQFTNDKNMPFNTNNAFVLNAGFTYRLSQVWKAWAKGENLLDQPYQRWADYPSLGLQLITGVVYSFHK